MKTTIKAQKARLISGIGVVLQFNVIEGVVKPGMKLEGNGEKFEIGDRMVAFKDQISAEKSIMLEPIENKEDVREISEAKPEDNIVQVNIKTTAENPVQKLLNNKSGLFILES